MHRRFSWAASFLVAVPLVIVACGDDDGGTDDPTGGTAGGGKGGSSGSGARSGNGGKPAGGAIGMAGEGGELPTAGSPTGGTSPVAGSGGTSGGTTGGTSGGTTPLGGTSGEGGTSAGEGGVGGVPDDGGTPGGGGAGGMPEGGTGGVVEGGTGGVPEVTAGAGGEGGAGEVVFDTLQNGGFEDDTGWTITGTGAVLKHASAGGAHKGQSYLALWAAGAYTATVSQVVSPLPEGYYQVTFFHAGGADSTQIVTLHGFDASDPEATAAVNTSNPAQTWPYRELSLGPVHVTSGELEIEIFVDSPADKWSNFDEFTLTQVPDPID